MEDILDGVHRALALGDDAVRQDRHGHLAHIAGGYEIAVLALS